MRIVFIGSVLFSKKMLEKLIELKANVVGVITKSQSEFNADFDDLAPIAATNYIPYKYVNNINHPGNINWIHDKKPDIIFCFGWSNLIKTELLKLPPKGVIGFHPSMLPANKGRHPLIWAKVLGLKETGSTFFFMDEGADTGDILDQKKITIDFEDTADIVYDKMIKTAISQLDFFLPKLQSDTYSRIPQSGIGNSLRKRNATDGLIDFRMNSASICNLVRALSYPYPGAHCYFNGTEIKIWDISLGPLKNENFEPGKVVEVNENNITVKTADGSVLLKKHTFQILPEVGDYIR